MNVLVIAAHPDDEVLGCGGTMARHAASGDTVDVLFAADGETSRRDATAVSRELRRENARTAAKILAAAPFRELGGRGGCGAGSVSAPASVRSCGIGPASAGVSLQDGVERRGRVVNARPTASASQCRLAVRPAVRCLAGAGRGTGGLVRSVASGIERAAASASRVAAIAVRRGAFTSRDCAAPCTLGENRQARPHQSV